MPIAEYGQSGAFSPDDLLAGEQQVDTIKATLLSGEGVVTRGTVVGIVTAGGKYRASAAANGDGSETPTAVVASESADATSADADTMVYQRADINQNSSKFQLGAGLTVGGVYEGLREKGIFLIDASQIG